MRSGAATIGRPTLKTILWLAAAGLVLATVFALLARTWWMFDLFSHFRLQYVIAALALGVLALALRAWPAAAVLLVVALVHGWAMRDLWLADSAQAGEAGTPLRLASANVLRSNPTPQAVAEWVRAADADLVMLVEAQTEDWRAALGEIAELYPHRAPAGWRDGAPVLLFSRRPILEESTTRPPMGRRPYLTAEVAVDGHSVTVVGVHPASPSPRDATDSRRRNLELDYIAHGIQAVDRPVLVAGDFNTTPWSPHFRDLLDAANLRLAAAGHGYVATWPRSVWPARIPIDHVLVKGPVAVADFTRGPSIGSDHFPVIADLRVRGG